MKSQDSVLSLKGILHEALRGLEGLETCAMVDWPRWKPNLGSHLVWLATGLYLKEVAGARVTYVASPKEFSRSEMLRRIGTGAILLRGGYFGDFWGKNVRQDLLEGIIAECTENPVYLMPQSFWFEDPERLKQTARIINAHPRLTVFARDQGSLAYAKEHFPRIKVVLSPDMAFYLAGTRGLPRPDATDGRILYLRRKDWVQSEFAPERLGVPGLVAGGDWPSFRWFGYRGWSRLSRIPGLEFLLREGWQRGLARPGEWMARRRWMRAAPRGVTTESVGEDWLHPSWSWVHSGFLHLSRYRLVITNRLHAHISCLLLGIPHVLVPGPYGKMRAFYESWSNRVGFCRLVDAPEEVPAAVEQLLAGDEV
jgi:exopolysaccharide biosynthesis predicted pyruvyltransferase EpsI